jgi:hypothetical protein
MRDGIGEQFIEDQTTGPRLCWRQGEGLQDRRKGDAVRVHAIGADDGSPQGMEIGSAVDVWRGVGMVQLTGA